ncbi:hypothetical protein [Yersinia massiliensis]|uniref:hypothetical protein n=1 Tax=Yersinia massiliensis TaxID=419257 RepID=UPI00030B3F23|nr:hypothetical protein [Yersinia massiliensis]
MDKHIEELDRQEFETWFISLFHPHHMNRNESGSYFFIDANVAWTAWQERGKALLAKLEAAEKQVKEMTEQYLDRNTALTFVTLRAEAAEARLLVPVEFPDCDIGAVSHMAHWYSEKQCEAWVAGVEFSKKQIIKAGFKVEGG